MLLEWNQVSYLKVAVTVYLLKLHLLQPGREGTINWVTIRAFGFEEGGHEEDRKSIFHIEPSPGGVAI